MNDADATPSYHRRVLPETCIAFSSKEGVQIFKRALNRNTMGPFFALSEQMVTQAEPAYCGLATLVMVLNALAIDPGRVWKGVWRWFSEEMLGCCKDLKNVQSDGISLEEFACLSRCYGANAAVQRGPSIDAFRREIVRNCSGTLWDRGVEGGEVSFLCLNYCRKTLGQTGSGHFSPVAGYDEASDRILVLDVARFKYAPHWVSVDLMQSAMLERGFAVISPAFEKASDGGKGGPLLGCEGCCRIDGFDAKGRPKG